MFECRVVVPRAAFQKVLLLLGAWILRGVSWPMVPSNIRDVFAKFRRRLDHVIVCLAPNGPLIVPELPFNLFRI
ncbi:hypothetical protein BD769DRAFT_1480493 [Suillus cothurnatus]|nr:hypothetical protein BD769DRAFT_1480493 [Suillus cothurnatus]